MMNVEYSRQTQGGNPAGGALEESESGTLLSAYSLGESPPSDPWETLAVPLVRSAQKRQAECQLEQSSDDAGELWAARYRIESLLGRGSTGDIYLARDIMLNRCVALKVLRAGNEGDAGDQPSLLREARAAACVDHERIARIYDAGSWEGRAFIAMEYVQGDTLLAWMERECPSEADVVAILQQLLEGLAAIHEKGLVHRDLKPENIMVTPTGSLRILDLGIARSISTPNAPNQAGRESPLEAPDLCVGTPRYMAPEQWAGSEVDARADIFAIGVMAYELVAGERPFRGATVSEIRAQTLNKEPDFDQEPWGRVSPELGELIGRALSKTPACRFQSTAAMQAALTSLCPSLPPPSSRFRRSNVGGRSPRVRSQRGLLMRPRSQAMRRASQRVTTAGNSLRA